MPTSRHTRGDPTTAALTAGVESMQGIARSAAQAAALFEAARGTDQLRSAVRFADAAAAGELAATAGLTAIDRAIAKSAVEWRASLVATQNIAEGVRAVGLSVSDAVAARQTYLSDALSTFRVAGVETLPAFTEMQKYLKDMQVQLAEPMRIFAQQAELTRGLLSDALRPAALAATSNWATTWRARTEQQREDARALQRDGWPLMPQWPVSRPARLVELRRREGKRALDMAVCTMYSAHEHLALRELVDSWMEDPVFRARRPIIREALALHTERRFKSSIPTLLPNIEGVLVDVFAPTTQRVDPAKLYKQAVDPGRLHGLLVEGLVATLEVIYGFEPFAAVGRRSRKLHRHAILHGRTTNYGSEVNSLKVFLILNLVAGEARAKREADATASVA